MDDFEFDYDFEGNPIYEMGAYDFSNLFGDVDELMNFDLGGLDLSGFDIGSADEIYQGSDFGDDGAGTIVITGDRQYPGFDFETADEVYQGSDFGWDPFEVDGFQGSRDEFNALTGLEDPYEVDGRQGSRDEDDALTPPKGDKCPPGSETVQKFRDGSTLTLDCKGRVIGSTPATVDPDDPDPDGCPPNSTTSEKLADGTIVYKNCKGVEIGRVPPTVTPKPDDKPVTPPKKPVVDDNWARLLALLGGIMGLQNKPRPVGYQGGIPKYTATRGTPMSPTAGGRRPGGAGIPSLTGGVTYTPVGAAQGGLMGLAAGGKARSARYLAGGTDGMADKIQTSIDGKQPARLSHGEFVIPADVVSHLGNGNSDAGADVLYEMMAKVRKARTGNSKQGKQINPRKYTPA